MWGRRQPSGNAVAGAPGVQTAQGTQAKNAAVAGRPRALSTVEELLRHAEWDRLSDADRASLLAAYPPLNAPAAATGGAGHDIDDTVRDWVATLVALRFQPEAAGVMRGWLDNAPPGTHLYIGGRAGQGRTSLISSLARQAMAKRPAPPDYCYVPQAASLDRAQLLTLPTGTGADFVKALGNAFGAICQGWQSSRSDDGGSNDGGSNDAGSQAQPAQASPRKQLIAAALGPVASSAPAPAHQYLDQLVAALADLDDKGETPDFCSDNETPLWYVHMRPNDGSADDGQAPTSAPVVIASLVQGDLTPALVRANGGVLVLRAEEVVASDGAWINLSAALRSGLLPLKNGWPPLPLAVRVVLIGDSGDYATLYGAAGEFERLFRYEVWCNPIADWTRQTEATYAALADGVARRYGLPAFDPSGAARLVEEGARRAENLNRMQLTTDLLVLRDLAFEAGGIARARGAATTGGMDVEAALQVRRRLQSFNGRRVRAAILTGQEITPTAGAGVGQINGLGVVEVHPSDGNFAVPTRISATVSPGRDERLFDIEREAEQADADHVRGEMTVEGYLAHRYGQGQPINVLARIRFEQEHGSMGGDSASAALLFALLSALAQVPIRFSYAVTGAVGQYGEIQPIGDVNTKIEGFWDLCRVRHAQGEQAEGGYGVLIPAVNARDLMLRAEVAESIAREGWFHVFPISTVEEGIALLTGAPAEQVHARVDQRLQLYRQLAARERA